MDETGDELPLADLPYSTPRRKKPLKAVAKRQLVSSSDEGRCCTIYD